MTDTPDNALLPVEQIDRDAAALTAADHTNMHDDPAFVLAWMAMEERGYHYGDDALENVHLGWCLARHRLAFQPAPETDVGWQPIENAPKDGSYILFAGSNFDGGMAVVQWDDGLDWWTLDDGKNPEIMLRHEAGLTHWRPLPTPPDPSQPKDG